MQGDVFVTGLYTQRICERKHSKRWIRSGAVALMEMKQEGRSLAVAPRYARAKQRIKHDIDRT